MIFKRRIKDEDNSVATINSIVSLVKGLIVAFVLAFITLTLVGLIASHNFQDQRNRDNLQDTTQLHERLVENCLNYNRDKTIDRIAAHEKVISLADFANRPLDLNDPVIIQKFAVYDARMAELYAYRHCDLDCAISYTKKDVVDCPPSDNEEGT